MIGQSGDFMRVGVIDKPGIAEGVVGPRKEEYDSISKTQDSQNGIH
jgi:hypothetical protein